MYWEIQQQQHPKTTTTTPYPTTTTTTTTTLLLSSSKDVNVDPDKIGVRPKQSDTFQQVAFVSG